MAFEAPSGLMGKPEKLDEYTAFQVEDVVFYIADNVLETRLVNNLLHIYIEGYGRFEFKIIKNI